MKYLEYYKIDSISYDTPEPLGEWICKKKLSHVHNKNRGTYLWLNIYEEKTV